MLWTALLLAATAPAEPIYTFDVTYTHRLSVREPATVRRIWDETHFVASIQGIVNRSSPSLYVFQVGEHTGRFDRFWLERMQESGGLLAGRPVVELTTIDEVARRFRSRLRGAVVYDEKVPATSNLASTAAGVEDLACLRYDAAPGSLYHRMVLDPSGPRLPVKLHLVHPDGDSVFTGRRTIPGTKTPSTGSAKCDAYLWAKHRWLDSGRCNPARLAYYLDAWWLRHPDGYIPNHTLTNHDYFIAERGFFFDLSPWDDETPVDDRAQPVGADVRALKAILLSAWQRTGGRRMIHVGGFVPWPWKYTNYGQAGGKREGVPAEWRYAEILSCFNAYMDADAIGLSAMANASVFRKHPLAKRYPQRKPTLADLRSRGLVDAEGRVARKSFVAIYGGDYDAAAWLYWRLPDVWPHPDRGAVPVGWAFNPNLADRFPLGMDYARRNARPADTFIAGDCGAGYVNPSYLVEPRPHSNLPSGLSVWEEHCRRYYQQWDLSITGFIIDGFARATAGPVLDAYARFSPDGVIGQKTDREGMHGSMPVLRMEWDIYDVRAGADTILSRTRPDLPRFSMYRTIIWGADRLKSLVDNVKSDPRGRNIEFVDPYTLMLLLKQHRTGPDQGRKSEAPPVALKPGEVTNVWAVQSGATVTGHSEVVPGCDARDLLAGVYGNVESGDLVLFADNKPDGFVHWVEWRTARPVQVERVLVYAQGDGGNENRECAELRVCVKDDSGSWQPLTRFTPEHPYRFEDRSASLLHSATPNPPRRGQEFRAEFVQRTVAGMTPMGPRVIEIVGIGSVEPTAR